MMTPREKVFAAADALLARGDAITQIAIRTEMGGGSFSTITPFLKEWRLENKKIYNAVNNQNEELPEFMKKILKELAGRVWIEAQNIALLEIEKIRAEIKNMETERDEALIKARISEDAWGRSLADLASAHTELEKVKLRVASESTRADVAESEVKRLNSANVQ